MKLLLLQGGGANLHFISCTKNCKNNSTCIVKQEVYSQLCSMFLENVNFIYIKKCHHILNMVPDFPCKRIDLCHKISIILVFITRPNSTKNIICPKQTICT